MYGLDILKTMGVTLGRFLMTFWDDLRWFGRRYTLQALPVRQSPKGRGIFTVQYPKEKLPLPENYRCFPFHVIDPETGKTRCTACGICARVCPPQCIWIVRATDPQTGKALREPAEFTIDVSICMSCGLCAELCPFGAIKMDHDYSFVSYRRDGGEFLWNLERISKPLAYHAQIHPTAYLAEQAEMEKKAAKKQ